MRLPCSSQVRLLSAVILHPSVSPTSSSNAFFAFLHFIPAENVDLKRNCLQQFLARILQEENERNIINAEML